MMEAQAAGALCAGETGPEYNIAAGEIAVYLSTEIAPTASLNWCHLILLVGASRQDPVGRWPRIFKL